MPSSGRGCRAARNNEVRLQLHALAYNLDVCGRFAKNRPHTSRLATVSALAWRRVVTKVEWHPGELVPHVGYIVTNLSRPAERVVAFYNHRGTAEQYIKEGKNAFQWTRLSCRKFRNNAVRLQLHALAYNLEPNRVLATSSPTCPAPPSG